MEAKTMNHFEKIEVSVRVTSLITYLESQAEMIEDKQSDKYKKTISMVEIITKMRRAYNDVFEENCKLIDMIIEKSPNEDEFIKCLSEQYKK